jgi:hypothetical protein
MEAVQHTIINDICLRYDSTLSHIGRKTDFGIHRSTSHSRPITTTAE